MQHCYICEEPECICLVKENQIAANSRLRRDDVGEVAQGLERGAHNATVDGSSPSLPTTDQALIEGLARVIADSVGCARITEIVAGKEHLAFVPEAQAALLYMQQHVRGLEMAMRKIKALAEPDEKIPPEGRTLIYTEEAQAIRRIAKQALSSLPPVLRGGDNA